MRLARALQQASQRRQFWHWEQQKGDLDMSSPINVVGVEFTRPADVSAYSAGDVVSQDTTTTVPLAFTEFARVQGHSLYLVGARAVTDKQSITPHLRLHLYNELPTFVSGDNVLMKRRYSDEAAYLGFVDLPAMSSTTGAGVNESSAQDMTLRHPVKMAAGTKSLWVVVETLDAFTPASNQKFTIRLWADQN